MFIIFRDVLTGEWKIIQGIIRSEFKCDETIPERIKQPRFMDETVYETRLFLLCRKLRGIPVQQNPPGDAHWSINGV